MCCHESERNRIRGKGCLAREERQRRVNHFLRIDVLLFSVLKGTVTNL